MELKEIIKTQWDEYVKDNGHEPKFAHCSVNPTGEYYNYIVNICMDDSGDTESRSYDKYVYFYCRGLDGLLRLCEYGHEDFVLTELFDFFDEDEL